MRHDLDFAPISSKPSTRLSLVVGYLRINGWAGLGLVTVAGIGALAGSQVLRAAFAAHPLGAITAALGALGLLFAAHGLARRQRAAAVAAGAIFAAPCIAALFQVGVSGETLVIGVLGLAAVASAWGELE